MSIKPPLNNQEIGRKVKANILVVRAFYNALSKEETFFIGNPNNRQRNCGSFKRQSRAK